MAAVLSRQVRKRSRDQCLLLSFFTQRSCPRLGSEAVRDQRSRRSKEPNGKRNYVYTPVAGERVE
jgi:hypothetical protein